MAVSLASAPVISSQPINGPVAASIAAEAGPHQYIPLRVEITER